MRIGAVSYLNTKPLVEGLLSPPTGVELVFDLPSRLADQLALGELDVALIPSIEFFQNPAYTIVSDACIGCRGPVWSVKLLSRVPAEQIQTLALDEGSRTSASLARILLKEKFGLEPELLPFAIGSQVEDSPADALVVIGDRAMRPLPGPWAFEWDLGDQWCRWAELPFVFAMWVGRAGVDLSGLDELLSKSRDVGLARLGEIAEREAAHYQLSPAQCLAYFRDNLHFVLGSPELRGLKTFYQHASQLGLAPTGIAIADLAIR